MSTESSKITGKVILINTFADKSCIPETNEELLKLLTERLAVQFPGNQADTFVIVSNQAPGATDRNKLWLATDLSGSPIALRKFVNGRWVDLLGFGMPWVQDFLGNPNQIPEGWQALDGTNGTIDTSGSWINFGSNTLYKAIFVG